MDEWVLNQTPEARISFFDKLQDPTADPRWPQLVETWLLPFYKQRLLLSEAEGGFGLVASAGTPSDAELKRLAWAAFDRPVATQSKHLHRLPFSVHEKTGRVAIPFDSADGMPRCSEDMPLVSDPDLPRKLEGPLSVLQKAVEGLSGPADLPLGADVHPVENAPWLASKRRKKQAGARGLGDRAKLADLRIDIDSATAWQQLLEEGSRAPDVDSVPPEVRPVIRKTCMEGKDWRKRLYNEAVRVGRLVEAVGPTGLLKGEPHTWGGRTLTFYPQLDQSSFFQGFANATKHAVTGHKYNELDFSAAHLAIAWGAVVLFAGGHEAANAKCPRLCLAATDKEAARELVARQCKTDLASAKRRICAAINQERAHGCDFLSDLSAERLHMKEALREHPFIVGERLLAIQRRVAENGKQELSLLFHALEGELLRSVSEALLSSGLEIGAYDADGIFARPTRALADGETTQQAIDGSLHAAHELMYERLQIRMTMELETDPRWGCDAMQVEEEASSETQPPPIEHAGGPEGSGDGAMSEAGSTPPPGEWNDGASEDGLEER